MYATITQKSHAVLTSLVPRSRPAFHRLQYGLHWKRQKAERGLGTRLVLTIFTCTLQRGWVRSPGHAGTHCTHLCPWNQPWSAAVGYGRPFCCTLEVINRPSAWRSWLHTSSCNGNKISEMIFLSYQLIELCNLENSCTG